MKPRRGVEAQGRRIDAIALLKSVEVAVSSVARRFLSARVARESCNLQLEDVAGYGRRMRTNFADEPSMELVSCLLTWTVKDSKG